jgi:hypothetical protein
VKELVYDRGSRIRFQEWDGNFSLLHRVQTGPTHPMATRSSLPDAKQPGREADYSPPSSAKVKNVWHYTFTPPMRLHGVVLS